MDYSTTLIVFIIVGSIVNWIILYLVIQSATKTKDNFSYLKSQYELLKQLALRNGVDQEIVEEIDITKNRMLSDMIDIQKWQSFKKRVESETVYFKNSLENAYIRSEPGNGFWIKFPDKPEYKAKDGSTIVSAGILESKEIKKKKYETG